MLRVAVLGAGFMGGTHARAYVAHDDVQVATIYAHSDTRAAPLAAELGCAWTDDLARAVTDPDIDAVSVCLPTPDHRFATEAALDAGKHVLLEKPIALTDEDAAAVVARADQTDHVVMVGHVLRFWPQYVAIANLVDAGQLGTLRSAVASRRQALPTWSSMVRRGDLTGGAVIDMLVHDFDMLNQVFGEPASVVAHGQRNPASGAFDQVQVLIDYGDGRSAVVDGGMMMPESSPFTSSLQLLGTTGFVDYQFEGAGRSVESGPVRNELRFYPTDGEPARLTVSDDDPYQVEIDYFLDCIRQGRPADRAAPTAAWLALRVGLAAVASLEAGGDRVAVEPVAETPAVRPEPVGTRTASRGHGGQ